MITEYKNDLKALRKQRLREELRKNHNDKSIVSQMISSTEYSLFWLSNGYERPIIDNSPTKQSKCKREQLWGEMEHAKGIEQGVWDVYSWEETETDTLTDKQLEKMVDVEAIMNSFSNQELMVFCLKNQSLLEVSEIAEELNITERAVYDTEKRINFKIEKHFNSDYVQTVMGLEF